MYGVSLKSYIDTIFIIHEDVQSLFHRKWKEHRSRMIIIIIATVYTIIIKAPYRSFPGRWPCRGAPLHPGAKRVARV